MIDFEEEIKKFHPSLEVEEAEDAIYNNDLTDGIDIMMELLKEKEWKEMKYKIFIGEMVSVEDFEFYKDDKYSGRTIQNNILYLAKLYGIKIPLATQGFINNRLKSYNFKTRDCFYKITDENKRCSTKMGIYLEQIYQKIQEEYKESFKRKMKLVPEKSMER